MAYPTPIRQASLEESFGYHSGDPLQYSMGTQHTPLESIRHRQWTNQSSQAAPRPPTPRPLLRTSRRRQPRVLEQTAPPPPPPPVVAGSPSPSNPTPLPPPPPVAAGSSPSPKPNPEPGASLPFTPLLPLHPLQLMETLASEGSYEPEALNERAVRVIRRVHNKASGAALAPTRLPLASSRRRPLPCSESPADACCSAAHCHALTRVTSPPHRCS